MTVRKKVITGFCVILGLLLFLGALAVFQMSRMGDQTEEIKQNWMPSVEVMGWMNGAVSDVARLVQGIGLESDQSRMDEIEKELNQLLEEMAKRQKEYEPLISSDEEQALYDKFNRDWQACLQSIPVIIKTARTNDFVQTSKLIRESLPVWNDTNQSLAQLIDLNKTGSMVAAENALSIFHFSFFFVASVGLVAIAVGVALTIIIYRNLRTVTMEIKKSSEIVATSAEEITASVDEIARGNQQQAGSVAQVSEMMEQMNEAINLVSGNIEKTSEFVSQTVSVAADGGQMMQQAIAGMKEITEKVNELFESSKKVDDIIGAIRKIADQTNLLSLNASIEAARAGEHGRGFAVVANEVGKLAKQSGDATKEIIALVKQMQTSTFAAVETVKSGNELVLQAEKAFNEIVQLVEDSSFKVTEVASNCEEQAAQTAEVMLAAQSIAAITEQTSASAQETSAAIAELAQMAEKLNDSMVRL
ncbi:methyl-accepting chemotaxis protein [Brevibacillus sp. B_LB10_24]|uniref:HAMP domain-containing methyl-accepting chemotaxis protein n=1 Tax=Brevibacillus sp. B_LB10_24 TaxID=3380645 RepID=UPI0038B7B13A